MEAGQTKRRDVYEISGEVQSLRERGSFKREEEMRTQLCHHFRPKTQNDLETLTTKMMSCSIP